MPLWSLPIIAMTMWAVWYLERKYPAEKGQPNREVLADWKLAGVHIVLVKLIGPWTKACTILITNSAGGGWIEMPFQGYWFLLSLVIAILAIDFMSYLIHRASHAIPILWAMHSLHHSAESLSIITGARHFWLEDVINTIAFSILGIIFKFPPSVAALVPYLYLLPCMLSHMNVRLPLGRFSLVINNPQYHRIHHSIEPQHWNKNFCQMLPLFDVIFGTAWKPGKGEFPQTGLVPSERATGFLDGLIWPVRDRLRAFSLA